MVKVKGDDDGDGDSGCNGHWEGAVDCVICTMYALRCMGLRMVNGDGYGYG